MRNEAAERLRSAMQGCSEDDERLLDEALAAEYERGKRATVKAIDESVRADERRATVREILERLEGQASLIEKQKLYARIRKVILEVAE